MCSDYITIRSPSLLTCGAWSNVPWGSVRLLNQVGSGVTRPLCRKDSVVYVDQPSGEWDNIPAVQGALRGALWVVYGLTLVLVASRLFGALHA